MKVNTIIIGAGRSGTTSVYEYLKQHPEVSFSITKEVHYFSLDDLNKRGEKYFHSLFNTTDKKIIATADTYLLIDKIAPQRIKDYNAEIKIIVMLREPVARTFSNYNYSVNFGHEQKGITFLQTIELEKQRLKNPDIAAQNNLCHFYGSLYYEHLSYWMKYFPKENFIILKLEDLIASPQNFYKNLCSQLNILYAEFENAENKFNSSTGVKSKWLQQFLLNRNNPLRKITGFILRPFRNLIIKSGAIEKVYSLNKKKTENKILSPEEFEISKKYFESDLKKLKEEFGIEF